MDKKKLIVLIILAIIIILSFLIGLFFPKYEFCTEMGCPCEGIVGERPCNSCTNINPIFVTGIINIVKTCSAQEVILCENGINVGGRIDIDENSCKIKLQFFGIN